MLLSEGGHLSHHLDGIHLEASSAHHLKVINLAAICTLVDYNTRPLDTIYSNFIDALPMVKYCSKSKQRLIHFSTCEVYVKTIGSFLPKDSPFAAGLWVDRGKIVSSLFDDRRFDLATAGYLVEILLMIFWLKI